jgi:hypothetical protein
VMEKGEGMNLLETFVDLVAAAVAQKLGKPNSFNTLQLVSRVPTQSCFSKRNQIAFAGPKSATKRDDKQRYELLNFDSSLFTFVTMKRKRGTGCLYQRSGIWWIKFHDHGKPCFESARTKDRGRAEWLLSTRLSQRIVAEDTDPIVKALARRSVRDALRREPSLRPDRCSACGAVCKPAAHHEDYGKPLDVTWLCSRCHAKADTDRRLRLVGKIA